MAPEDATQERCRGWARAIRLLLSLIIKGAIYRVLSIGQAKAAGGRTTGRDEKSVIASEVLQSNQYHQ